MNIQHSTRTDLWYTPQTLIDLVHQVLGQIDLDPASDQFANRRIKATRIITEYEDALKAVWPVVGTLFCNPPGGKIKNKSKTALFWAKLMQYRSETPEFHHGIFLAFSAEALQNTQGKGCPSIMEFPFCVPSKRLAFDDAYGNPGHAPSHSNVVVYVPGAVDRRAVFADVFSVLGATKL